MNVRKVSKLLKVAERCPGKRRKEQKRAEKRVLEVLSRTGRYVPRRSGAVPPSSQCHPEGQERRRKQRKRKRKGTVLTGFEQSPLINRPECQSWELLRKKEKRAEKTPPRDRSDPRSLAP